MFTTFKIYVMERLRLLTVKSWHSYIGVLTTPRETTRFVGHGEPSLMTPGTLSSVPVSFCGSSK